MESHKYTTTFQQKGRRYEEGLPLDMGHKEEMRSLKSNVGLNPNHRQRLIDA